jgi:hypothetical protein
MIFTLDPVVWYAELSMPRVLPWGRQPLVYRRCLTILNTMSLMTRLPTCSIRIQCALHVCSLVRHNYSACMVVTAVGSAGWMVYPLRRLSFIRDDHRQGSLIEVDLADPWDPVRSIGDTGCHAAAGWYDSKKGNRWCSQTRRGFWC